MLFDFHSLVRRYKLRKLRVVRVCRRAADHFALEFVLGLTADKTHTRVRNQTTMFRNIWASRMKALASNYLWFPNTRLLDPDSPNFDLKKFELTYRRMLFCRPTFVHYFWRYEKVLRPCNRSHFCPFCFARTVTYLYRRLKSRLNTLAAKNAVTQLLFTVRITRRFIYATNFDPTYGCHPLQIDLYVEGLQTELRRHKAAYKKCVKTISRNTLGSMCRTFILPTDLGWVVETRQCFIHAPKKKIPYLPLTDSVVKYEKTVSVLDCADKDTNVFFTTFGEFCRYPLGLLRAHVEFTAAVLRATHGVRLSTGTGILRVTSRRLWRIFKQEKLDAKLRRAAKLVSPETEEPAAPAVRPRPSPTPDRVPV